jgi:hypothetical protein
MSIAGNIRGMVSRARGLSDESLIDEEIKRRKKLRLRDERKERMKNVVGDIKKKIQSGAPRKVEQSIEKGQRISSNISRAADTFTKKRVGLRTKARLNKDVGLFPMKETYEKTFDEDSPRF